MKKKILLLISNSDTAPSKLILGTTSLLWVLLDCFSNFQSNSYFMAMMFFYGAWLIWRIFDYQHRAISSTIMSSMGVALWSYELWYTVLYDGFEAHPALHYAARIVLLLTSVWILIRIGTNNLNKK